MIINCVGLTTCVFTIGDKNLNPISVLSKINLLNYESVPILINVYWMEFQTITVRSADPLHNTPSFVTHKQVTNSLCPSYTAIHSPVNTFHALTVLSSDAEYNTLSLNMSALMPPV